MCDVPKFDVAVTALWKAMGDAKKSVLLAGGRKLFREGLGLLLEKDPRIQVIGESEDCADIVRLLRAMPAQVVILNLSQTQSGPDIIRAIQRACSGACVIVLTLSPSVEYVLELLDAGASGCLTKECASTELLAA